MKRSLIPFIFLGGFFALGFGSQRLYAETQYPWRSLDRAKTETIEERFTPPRGFRRVAAAEGSFAQWLRHLPLREGKPRVNLYNGQRKFNQLAHVAVIDMDTGKEDLQQCADFVIRLRAEYLYAQGWWEKIQFHYTSGDLAEYRLWTQGYRPQVQGSKVKWMKTALAQNSYSQFRDYLNSVFTYAGSFSLEKELKKVDVTELQSGDVFIQGGFPGHAVIVVDLAANPESGEKVFILAQSYTPAQAPHVLKNPLHWIKSPWYSNRIDGRLVTPEWVFKREDLRRFPSTPKP